MIMIHLAGDTEVTGEENVCLECMASLFSSLENVLLSLTSCV